MPTSSEARYELKNRKLETLMLAIIVVGAAHMGEQLIFGIEEFYILRG
jgi:hypothetical protein